MRLTETLVIMLPSIGVLLQKQVSRKMFNHAAINVSQLKKQCVQRYKLNLLDNIYGQAFLVKSRLGFCVLK